MLVLRSPILAALAAAALMAACATPPPPPPPPVVEAEPEPPPVEKPRIESQPLKHLAGRKLKAMPVKPLNVKTRCTFRDEVTGTRGRLDVLVKEDDVRTFAAEVNVPKHGACRFNLRDFAQRDRKQHPVTLTTKSDTCAVRIWEQESRVTVAFAECSARCDGHAFDYVWPILIDTRTGRCI